MRPAITSYIDSSLSTKQLPPNKYTRITHVPLIPSKSSLYCLPSKTFFCNCISENVVYYDLSDLSFLPPLPSWLSSPLYPPPPHIYIRDTRPTSRHASMQSTHDIRRCTCINHPSPPPLRDCRVGLDWFMRSPLSLSLSLDQPRALELDFNIRLNSGRLILVV